MDESQFNFLKLNWKTFAGIGAVSTVYFADLFLRASQKCFWFDELFTMYLCRLPNFKSTWTAVTHGADFNPPVFYLLTRGAQRLFGEGLIASRLPALLGVWLFGVCLFVFVARRAGVVSGSIAGLFPFFTLVQFYAYEAQGAWDRFRVVWACTRLLAEDGGGSNKETVAGRLRTRPIRRSFNPRICGVPAVSVRPGRMLQPTS